MKMKIKHNKQKTIVIFMYCKYAHTWMHIYIQIILNIHIYMYI